MDNRDIMSIITSNLSAIDIMSLRCANKEIRDMIDIKIVRNNNIELIICKNECVIRMDNNVIRIKDNVYNGWSMTNNIFYFYNNGIIKKIIFINNTSIICYIDTFYLATSFYNSIDLKYAKSIILHIDDKNFKEHTKLLGRVNMYYKRDVVHSIMDHGMLSDVYLDIYKNMNMIC